MDIGSEKPPVEIYNIPPDQLNQEVALSQVKAKKRGKVRRFFNYIATKMCSNGAGEEEDEVQNDSMARIEKQPRFRSSEYKRQRPSMGTEDEKRLL